MKKKIPFIKNKWFHKQHNRWYVTLSDGQRLQYARYSRFGGNWTEFKKMCEKTKLNCQPKIVGGG